MSRIVQYAAAVGRFERLFDQIGQTLSSSSRLLEHVIVGRLSIVGEIGQTIIRAHTNTDLLFLLEIAFISSPQKTTTLFV
ncbi:hypothetical protein T11_3345 [Trichinella zimbabwensis]|uniref:Uncharacterized protein n=1 Tax=Trichinella zimbabwensis TaxID=268475 RepID=A0A0V1GY26_9BILA|nr:hypothetical protein T11_3345 [Trichinella zimbabwensis]